MHPTAAVKLDAILAQLDRIEGGMGSATTMADKSQ
jgi:hypothetical protein